MTEAQIRKLALAELHKNGWKTWCPVKAKYHETDLFGAFDCWATKRWMSDTEPQHRLIQWTTKSNMSARERKVRSKLKEIYGTEWTGIYSRACTHFEVWGYDTKSRKFVEEVV